MAKPHMAEAIGNGSGETIGSREVYFEPVALDKDPLFCGDDRALSDPYIQLFGGEINLAYTIAVLEEAAHPGAVTDSLKGRVEALTAGLLAEGMHPGVHSDEQTEGAAELNHDHDPEGPVGCAYADKRPLISRSIAELGGDLADEATRLRPELFLEAGDRAFAMDVVAAHGRLASRKGFQAPGRVLVLAAVDKGAEAAVLKDEHIATDGIINLVPDTSFDGASAAHDGLPAYNHDAWAAEAAFDRLDSADGFEPNKRRIANLIDALGTMHALGVEAIAVRR